MIVFQTLKFKILGAFDPGVDIYLVSSDKTFVNRLSLEIATNTDYKITTANTGEELLKILANSKLNRKTLSLAIVDSQLQNRENKLTLDGIIAIKEIRSAYPHFQFALVYDEKNGSVLLRAAEYKIETCILKNKNADIRILHFIYNHVNTFQVRKDREFTKRFIIYVSLMIAVFVGIIGLNFIVNVN